MKDMDRNDWKVIIICFAYFVSLEYTQDWENIAILGQKEVKCLLIFCLLSRFGTQQDDYIFANVVEAILLIDRSFGKVFLNFFFNTQVQIRLSNLIR